MRSLRKKNTAKNQQCLDPFWMIPVEVIVMILLKLPAKYIGRLIFVSKHLSSIICSKNFMELYATKSSTQPCLLFIYKNIQSQFLELRSQEDPTYNDHQKVNLTLHPSGFHAFSPPVHGLICRQLGTKVMVGNPSTGQFITLPRVKTRRRGLFSFFGYDPVNDVYKVLCMTVLHIKQCRRGSLVVSEEHQVLTLGPKQKWRKIACKHPHLPPLGTKGICINGVVYYSSWIRCEAFLICFDLTSEDFSVVKLPDDIQGSSLVNYSRKIALCSQFMTYYDRINMWVLQDAEKQEWSIVSHSVSPWIDLVGIREMSFEGTLSTGQLIFAPYTFNPDDPYYFFVSYDPKDNSTKKVVIQGMESDSLIKFYLDYVETPMILSNVC